MGGVHTTRPRLSGGLSRTRRLVAWGALGLLLILLLSWSGIVQTLELATYELRLWLRGSRPPPPSIVIIAINDESFNFFQQNIRTWQRTNYARLIDTVAAGRPAVIGVDIAWVHASANDKDDEAPANSLQQAGNVVLASVIEQQVGAGYEYSRYAAPVAPLNRVAAGLGEWGQHPYSVGCFGRNQ